MAELFKRKAEVDDPDRCSVKGCDLPVKRTLGAKGVQDALPEMRFKVDKPRKVRLCKDHYKEYKKATKEDRKLERLAWEH
jgi:hypothetical protein